MSTTPPIDLKTEIQASVLNPVPADHVELGVGLETQSSERGLQGIGQICLRLAIVGTIFIALSLSWAVITIIYGFWIAVGLAQIAHNYGIHFSPLVDLQISDYWVYLKVGVVGYAAIVVPLWIMCSALLIGIYGRNGGLTNDRKDRKHAPHGNRKEPLIHPKYAPMFGRAVNPVIVLIAALAIPIGSCVVGWWYGPGAVGDGLLIKNSQSSIAVGLLGSLFLKLLSVLSNLCLGGGEARERSRKISLDGDDMEDLANVRLSSSTTLV